ncbi:tyrosine-type recombinase/integrase [Riemerella columbina]|uniref:tyrosine-type recombinase/integrase n=1 Tax=Riemerella columbina TaxID=103810 RepID=UPI00266EC669|nr:tyrosine-type recombinase/integrase [Riemerella columbina]WKS94304.1 tyrosine-type recombinase/integrase [Riemerella columbina]
MYKQFRTFLEKQELSKNTISSYLWTVDYFQKNYQKLNKENLQAYKGYLVEHFKPQTVNLRLQALNKFLDFQRKDHLKLKFVKVQQKNFLENVISHADYLFLKEQLKKEGYQDWYFLVWFLGATGARISELIQIKAEHIALGYLDLYTKGGKIRRLYIPKILRNEAQKWLKEKGIFSGYIFLNKFGNTITTRGIAQQLKHFAYKYGLNPKVVYPHSFRHRFAKNFLEKCNDIAFLADLMGHESIETTRIYLRRTASEQQQIVDEMVTW